MPHINVLLVVIYVSCVLIGYILGRIHTTNIAHIEYPTTDKFFTPNTKTKQEIDTIEKLKRVNIDDSVLVHNIDTSGMEKKFEQISEIQQSDANIESSVNKLSQIIRR